MQATSIRISKMHFLVLTMLLVFLWAAASSAQTLQLPTVRNIKRNLVQHPSAVNCGLIFSECSETSGSSLFKQQPLHLPAAHHPCNLSESEKR